MCVVSMVGDHYRDKWVDDGYFRSTYPYTPQVSPEDVEKLRKEVEDMKKLLKRAKKYDEDNNEPNCEVDEKMELLKKIAEKVGVSMDGVI